MYDIFIVGALGLAALSYLWLSKKPQTIETIISNFTAQAKTLEDIAESKVTEAEQHLVDMAWAENLMKDATAAQTRASTLADTIRKSLS